MEPLRTCIGCGLKQPQSKMIRISRTVNGEINVDKGKRSPGRGAYICGNEECVEKIIKKHKLNRAFRTEVEPHIYDFIRDEIGSELNEK